MYDFFSSSEIDAKTNSNTMFLFAWISNANEFAIFVIRTDSYFDKFQYCTRKAITESDFH